jgi:lactate dehydrogenase-like 2-hydroxyacid dehydrogenase
MAASRQRADIAIARDWGKKMTLSKDASASGKPRILLVDRFTLGEASPALRAALEARMEPVPLWEIADLPQFIAKEGASIRALQTRSGTKIDTALLDGLSNLEIIVQVGAGLDQTPVAYAKARGIPVTHTPGVLTDDVADIAMGLLIGAARRLAEGDRYVRSGQWPLKGRFPLALKVSGKTCGILAMGRIGRAVARRAAGFDMEILYHGPRRHADLAYEYCADLEAMAQRCDFLVMCAPGGPETDKIVDERVLRALGPKGVVVNVGRGSTLDEAALEAVLAEGALGGAGLDVYASEPNPRAALLAMENVFLLPHVGSGTDDTRQDMHRLCLDNLFAHLDGKPLITPA